MPARGGAPASAATGLDPMTSPQPAPPRDNLRRRLAQRLTRLLLGKPVEPVSTLLPRRGVHRILICHISYSLGNALLLTPLLRELLATYPGAEVDILTRSAVADALYGHFPNVRRILRLPSHAFGHAAAYLGQLRHMRAQHYDLAIDAEAQSQSSRLMLALAHARLRLGYVSARKRGGVTHAVELPPDLVHKGKLPVHLLREALGEAPRADFPPLDVRLDAGERHAGLDALRRVAGDSGNRRLIGIFANATGPKLMAPEWWQGFMQALAPLAVDSRLVEIVPAFARSMLDDAYPTLFCSDIRHLGAALGALDAFITLDCGVMHLACAADARTIALFGPTNADEWGPYGPRNAIVPIDPRRPAEAASQVLRLLEADLARNA